MIAAKKTSWRLVWFMMWLMLLLVAFPLSGRAQIQTTSGITGTVTDTSGAVIVGADVVVNEQDTGAVYKTKTNGSGAYSFSSLLPGLYTIRVSFKGFRTEVITDRRILATQPATVDVTLQVGQAAETFTVSGQGAELLTTTSQTITGTITPTLVKNLPNISGSFFDLLTLAPGVVPQDANRSNGGLGISQTSSAYNYVHVGNTYNPSGTFVGGNRDSASNVSIDGSNVQDPVYQQTPQQQATDTVQELRVESANMSAEFGYGASGVNVITRTGTNHFHGDVYELLRNNVLDANYFFDNLAGQKLPHYEHNLFGATVGGPVVRDKLMFFFNYQGLRAQQTQNAQSQMPPDTYRSGNFSVNANSTPQTPLAAIPLYNPYRFDPVTGLRQPFPNNQIPLGSTTLCAPHPTCGDPVSLAFLNKWVLHNNAQIDNLPVFLGKQLNTITSDQYTARVDWLKSTNTTIYGRYTQSPVNQLAGSFDPLAGTSNPYASYNVVAHWIQAIGGTTVNHFFAGWSRPKWLLGRNTNVPDVSKEIGLMNTSASTGGPDFGEGVGYDMDVSGVFILQAGTNTYQLQDDLSHVRGRHNLKVGFSGINKRFLYHTASDDKGVFYFNGQYTTACPQGNATCEAARQAAGLPQGGDSFADFLLGASNENFVQLNPAPYRGYQTYLGGYVQDSWRATNKLTLNYGLRYEHWTPWRVPRHTVLTYDPATGNPRYALQNPLDYLDKSKCGGECAPLNSSVPVAGYNTGNLDFGPRVGLAYAATPSTVVRASFGIYYDGNVNDNQLSNLQTGGPPFTLRVEQHILAADTPVPTYTVSTQFPGSSLTPTSIPQPNQVPPVTYRFIESYLPTAAVDQWSLSVEQRIGQIWGLEVNYLGSHTTHEFQFLDLNAPHLPQGQYANLTLQQRRPYSGWGQLGTWAPIGWGRYNGLVASFKNANPWRGLTLITNFQWTKNIVSSHWGFSDIGNMDFRNPYTWAGDYTAAPPRRLVFGYYYQLPFGHGKPYGNSLNPVLDHFVSGWNVSGISTFASGGWAPIVDFGPDSAGQGLITLPNRICDPNSVPGGRTRLLWWNPACIIHNPNYGTYGNSNIAAFTVPGINNWDISIQKSTRTGFPRDSGEIQFRLDMFNGFNHTQWGSPTQYIYPGSAPNDGRISDTRPPRQMQVSLKYIF
jgi:carboxypeptidase family protein